MNPGRGKDELYRLVDALPEEKAGAAKKFLELLLGASSKLLPENLTEKLDLLERIVDSLPDATLAVDREGKVLVWNRAMEEMTGVKVVQDQSRYSPPGDVWTTRLLSPWERPFTIVWWRFAAAVAVAAGGLGLLLAAVAHLLWKVRTER